MSDWFVIDPDRISIKVRSSYSIRLCKDGSVLVTENGVKHRVVGLEAVMIRQEFRRLIGEDIADAAGIEPE